MHIDVRPIKIDDALKFMQRIFNVILLHSIIIIMGLKLISCS